MPKVHLFPTIDELLPGWRMPLQYVGDGEPAAAVAAPDTVLLTWILANLPANPISVQSATVSNNGTVAVAAGRQVLEILVVGGASGTFNLGTSASGTEIMENADFDTDGVLHQIGNYFHSGGTLHFSGGFSGSLTVKLVLINLT